MTEGEKEVERIEEKKRETEAAEERKEGELVIVGGGSVSQHLFLFCSPADGAGRLEALHRELGGPGLRLGGAVEVGGGSSCWTPVLFFYCRGPARTGPTRELPTLPPSLLPHYKHTHTPTSCTQ